MHPATLTTLGSPQHRASRSPLGQVPMWGPRLATRPRQAPRQVPRLVQLDEPAAGAANKLLDGLNP